MSWLIILGYLAKILVPYSHAKILQFRKNLDIFMVFYQDLPCFIMFLIIGNVFLFLVCVLFISFAFVFSPPKSIQKDSK